MSLGANSSESLPQASPGDSSIHEPNKISTDDNAFEEEETSWIGEETDESSLTDESEGEEDAGLKLWQDYKEKMWALRHWSICLDSKGSSSSEETDESEDDVTDSEVESEDEGEKLFAELKHKMWEMKQRPL